MNDPAAPSPSVREANRSRTRNAIVDAAAQLSRERGLVDFTMPEIAERSGVALRTLYRYFPKRQDLVDALAAVADQATALPPPESIDELEPWLVTAWGNLMTEETLIRAQHVGPSGAEVRRARIPFHREVMGRVIDQVRPGLKAKQRQDIVDLALLITSSAALLEFVDVLDIPVERAAGLATNAVITALRDFDR